jgi:hypothetical protein
MHGVLSYACWKLAVIGNPVFYSNTCFVDRTIAFVEGDGCDSTRTFHITIANN